MAIFIVWPTDQVLQLDLGLLDLRHDYMSRIHD
jgi:hypothetical protein